MVSSLDGFVAKKDKSISWMQTNDRYEKGVTPSEEYITDFLKTIDCYIMGSKTYEHALQLGWPYGETAVFVITKKNFKANKENVVFYSGELDVLLNDKIRPNYKNTWMVGGSMLTKAFLRLQLADEIIITITPIILGEGKLFFDYIGQEQLLHLKDVTAYKNGMVELWYEIVRKD